MCRWRLFTTSTCFVILACRHFCKYLKSSFALPRKFVILPASWSRFSCRTVWDQAKLSSQSILHIASQTAFFCPSLRVFCSTVFSKLIALLYLPRFCCHDTVSGDCYEAERSFAHRTTPSAKPVQPVVSLNFLDSTFSRILP